MSCDKAWRNFQDNDQDDDSGEWWHYLQVLLKYTEYNEPHESLTNKNIIDVSGFPHHDDHGHDDDGEGPNRKDEFDGARGGSEWEHNRRK